MSAVTETLKAAVAAARLPPELVVLFESTYQRGALDALDTLAEDLIALYVKLGASSFSLADIHAAIEKLKAGYGTL